MDPISFLNAPRDVAFDWFMSWPYMPLWIASGIASALAWRWCALRCVSKDSTKWTDKLVIDFAEGGIFKTSVLIIGSVAWGPLFLIFLAMVFVFSFLFAAFMVYRDYRNRRL